MVQKENLEGKEVLVNTPKDIVLSRPVAAGKRIYYIDVKQNSKGEYYIVFTESKKVKVDEGTVNETVKFEKHKIFLYKEDFDKFSDALDDVISFTKSKNA